MNIMELGAIGEVVGSVAVLATLVYLANQETGLVGRQEQSGAPSSRSIASVDAHHHTIRSGCSFPEAYVHRDGTFVEQAFSRTHHDRKRPEPKLINELVGE